MVKSLSLTVTEATSFWDKSIGLIGKEHPYPMLFRTRFGIHTFGMKYPIDVLVLDENNIVVKIKENLLPNSIFLWNPKYSIIIELPQNSLKKHQITLGKKLTYMISGGK